MIYEKRAVYVDETFKTDEKLRKLQLIEVGILDEFVRICEKYKLTYYLDSGTLIGAVRHRGFIPWDDDIDVTMPRQDYTKFCEVVAKELNPTYIFQSLQTDVNFPYPFSRMQKRNTVYANKLLLSMNLKSYGIWLDIFPLDKVKNTKFPVFFLQDFLRWIARCSWHYSSAKNCVGLPFGQRMRYLFAHCLPRRLWICLTNFLLLMDSDQTTEYVISGTVGDFGYGRKTLAPASWYGEPVKLEFEGKMYNAPREWDSVLKKQYGNYMQIPPIEKRRMHTPDVWEM